jgi:5-methyltetrahydropteroyltriglutamate--homocysteine methyltransferase
MPPEQPRQRSTEGAGSSMSARRVDLPLLATTVVGSYPQPDWLIDRSQLVKVPRVGVPEAWRVDRADLESAQDAATIVAVHEQERAGVHVVTDGEARRESYSNHFANALTGLDREPGTVEVLNGGARVSVQVPSFGSEIRRSAPVELANARFLMAHATHVTKVTLPGPFTMSQQAVSPFYADDEALAMAFAAVVNEEILELFAAGVDIVQLDEPWMQRFPERARSFGLRALARALDGVTGPVALHMCFGYAAAVSGDKPSRYGFLEELEDSGVDHISIEAAQPRLDLSSLAGVLPSKKLVVGVLDLGDPEVEPVDVIVERIERAMEVVGPERLMIGPDCGMKFLAPATAFGKLEAMVRAADVVRARLVAA